jgi:hypothetical protein
MSQFMNIPGMSPFFPGWKQAHRKPTVREITRGRRRVEVHLDKLLETYKALDVKKEYVALLDPVLPEGISPVLARYLKLPVKRWPNLSRETRAKVFIKRGPTIPYPRFSNYEEVRQATSYQGRKTIDVLIERVELARVPYHQGFNFVSPEEKNWRYQPIKRVTWSSLADGGKEHSYIRRRAQYERKEGRFERAEATKTKVKVFEEYEDPVFKYKDVRLVGAKATVVVPYRIDGTDARDDKHHEFDFEGISVVRNENMYPIGLSLRHNHRCNYDRGMLRFKGEGIDDWDDHVNSGWLDVVEDRAKIGNKVPYYTSPIPFVAQMFSDVSEHVFYDTVVHTSEYVGGPKRDFAAVDAERNIIIYLAVRHYSPRQMLTFNQLKDGVKKFWQKDWRFLHMGSPDDKIGVMK